VNATHKKQYNFVLNNNINAALDKLAEEHQLSRTKILEELILSETAHRLYLVTR
jgi:predicted transcriptional regulator